jgi:microsomal dipeptidase-like Zn-dependent dipeptidase
MNKSASSMLRVPLASLLAVALTGCGGFVRVADSVMNPVGKNDPQALTDHAKRLHRSLLVADLHADTLMFDRGGVTGIQKKHSYSHADVPRLKEGNVGFQMLTVATVTPVPFQKWMNGGILNGAAGLALLQGWPVRTWNSAHERGLYQAMKWRANANDDGLNPILTRGDLERFLKKHCRKLPDGNWTPINPGHTPVATLLGLEGCHALGLNEKSSDAEIDAALMEYWNAGFRSLALTHRFDNTMGLSSEGPEGSKDACSGGITPLGRRVLSGMAKKGFILDLAHASDALIGDVLEANVRIPMLISHTGVKYDGQEDAGQLTDRLTKKEDAIGIAKRRGVIGIGVFKPAVGTPEARNSALMIKGLSKSVGTKSLVLGSDMDGATHCGFGADGWVYLTNELVKLGMTEHEVRDVMGGNTIRFMLNALPRD